MENLKLRPVTMEDAECILAWRNDEDSRKNSFHSDLIDWEAHVAWLTKKLDNEECMLYMVSDGTEDVGHIRLDISDKIGEISYMVAPEKRGKGYGSALLKLISTTPLLGVKALVGLVQKKNAVSGKCFLTAGFTCFAGGDTDCYVKLIQ